MSQPIALGTAPRLEAARRIVLQRRIRWIVAATITYNALEGTAVRQPHRKLLRTCAT
jgi:hypothetical protein